MFYNYFNNNFISKINRKWILFKRLMILNNYYLRGGEKQTLIVVPSTTETSLEFYGKGILNKISRHLFKKLENFIKFTQNFNCFRAASII